MYIYLLIEFQSTNDHFMVVRMMGYLALMYQDLIRTEQLTTKDKLPPVLPIVLYNGERRWKAPLHLDPLIHPAPGELKHYRPEVRYLLLDEGCYDRNELSHLNNLVAALFQLENSRNEQDIQQVLVHLIEWLKDPAQTSLRRTFRVWMSRVILPVKAPGEVFPEMQDLHEVHTMLAERVKQWTQEWRQEGMLEGMEKGLEKGRQNEAARLFSVLLTAKFGSVSPEVQAQVAAASPEQIEVWTQHIFEAASPEALVSLNR